MNIIIIFVYILNSKWLDIITWNLSKSQLDFIHLLGINIVPKTSICHCLRKQRYHCIWVEGRDGKSDVFLLLFRPLSLRGLHIKDLRCSGIGCLAILESACVGLPANLLWLLIKVGVVSTDDAAIGANNLEYRAFLWFRNIDCCWTLLLPMVDWEAEIWSEFVMSEVVSGRSVATETRLLGWRSCAFDGAGGGLTAMDDLLLGFAIEFILAMFSFPSMEELQEGLLSDGWGKELVLVILLSGGLSEGISGVFFMAFSAAACFNDDTAEGWVAASDRLSCFSLIFLSSAIWCSRSLTLKIQQPRIWWVKQVHTRIR